MENELQIQRSTLEIDSHELLIRFLLKCKNDVKSNEFRSPILCSADIVTAVYYFRKYPNINDFINKYLMNNHDYFLFQWVRTTWASLSKMSPEELSNLVINQISIVANSEKD